MIQDPWIHPNPESTHFVCPHGDEDSPYHQKCRENAELLGKLQEAVEIGSKQAEAFDGLMEVMGFANEESTIEEVKAHYLALKSDNAALRAQVENIKAQIRREIPPADKDVAALFEEWQKVCDEDAASNAQCNEAWSKDKAQRDALLREKAERSKAAQDVLAERQRQITQEGWTPAHDDEHDQGELAMAAACYALPEEEREMHEHPEQDFPFGWPWPGHWWKPGERRRDLVKAGALILAEIERLDRANPEPPTCGHPVEVRG
jgi:hypothetical protein